MSNNKLKIPCSPAGTGSPLYSDKLLSRFRAGFDCKEFCQFFDSLANPVPLLSGTTGNALAVSVQSEQF